MPPEMLARIEAFTDDMEKADPYRRRNRNAAILALIDAGFEAKGIKGEKQQMQPVKKAARG